MVQSGASSLAAAFDEGDFMGAFQFAMTGISFLTRFANGTIFANLRYMTRFWIATLLAVAAFSLIAWACYEGEKKYFFVAVFASVCMGMSSAMGEATFLGFCNEFPKYVVGFVSSGTGCAGLTGTFTNLALQGAGLSNGAINLVVLPTTIIYICSATWLHRQKEANTNSIDKALG